MTYSGYGAQAIGIANIAADGTVLDTWFPEPTLIPPDQAAHLTSGTQRLGAADIPRSFLRLVLIDDDRRVEQVAVRTTIADLGAHPIDAHDVYLRFHLLSHRLVEPLTINLDNSLRILSPVVWTNKGPCLPDNFESLRTSLRSRGLIHVYGIEKLPRMVDYVVPPDVMIAEAERVRLGAYLAPGTRVLREGYVSFNSGSSGPSHIEGRLSSGTYIGADCMLEASSSFMATRQDSNRMPVTMGNGCYIGNNAGAIGITFGDDCRVDPSIVIEPDTQLYDLALDQRTTAASLDSRSHWRVHNSADHNVPVISWG